MANSEWFACPECIQPLGINIKFCHYCEKSIVPVLMTKESLEGMEGKWHGVNEDRERALSQAETSFDDQLKGSYYNDHRRRSS